MAGATILALDDAEKEYKRGKEIVRALKKSTLEIKDGEFIVVIGPSGCGKSTLLHVLSGLDLPTAGRSFLDGEDTARLDEGIFPKIRREKVGFVFQDFNLIEHLSAIENIEAPLWPTDMKASDIEKKSLVLLKTVDLLERMDHRPNQMSGGEQQRVAIARALVNDPKVIFADEPTGNLDTVTGKEIMDLLKKLNKEQGRTVVVVTHDESLLTYADKVIRMRDGEVTIEKKGRGGG